MRDPRFEFYAITDQASSLGRSDFEIASALIAGGATCLQYRAKKVSAADQWATAFQLQRLCREAGVIFIVNDRVDLAMDCDADAVHLGQDDTPIAAARRIAGKKMLIGRSTHSLQQAREAQEQGADYIGYGPLYLTGTKENNVAPVGPQSLSEILTAVSLPVVAIGGIKARHLAEVAAAGAKHIAVVTALTSAEDVKKVTQNFVSRWRDLVQTSTSL